MENLVKNFDAMNPSGGPLNCIVCEREISGGNWFARIKLGDIRVALCRPWCVEKFLDDRTVYARKLGFNSRTMADGVSSSGI